MPTTGADKGWALKKRMPTTGAGSGTTNTGYRTTNADAGVGIGMKRGDSKKLIEKAIN